MPCDRLEGECLQPLVHQIRRGRQSLVQRIERGLACRQRLGVAHKFKARVDRLAQHIGQVVEIQRRQMLGPLLNAQGAECPAQGVFACFADIHIQRGKAAAFRQVTTGDDAVGERRVAALQKGDDRTDGAQVAIVLRHELAHARAHRFRCQGFDLLHDSLQAIGAQQ